MAQGKIFLTGGAGFIGSHLCEALIDRYKIVVFDNFKRSAIEGLKVKDHANLTLVTGDIRDRQQLDKAFGDCDAVIHCAAIAGIDSVGISPIATMETNLMGSHNLLEVAKERKLRRYIQFSTSEVYGPYIYKGTENDLTSQGPIGQVRWTYAVSKLAAEHLAFAYRTKYDMPVVSVRPFNIYGPRQVGEGAIQKFIQKAVADEDITINGDGSQIRSWCYISDFVDGILRCMENEKAVGNVFNLGNPQSAISIAELANLVASIAGSKSKIKYRPQLEADVEVRVPSTKKAQDLLGFSPNVGLQQGIEQTVKWFKK